jgi:hypothetical protein
MDRQEVLNLAILDTLVNTPQINAWTWVDAIHMAMPVLAKLGWQTGDRKYFYKMRAMYEYTRNMHGGGLFNTKDGLWWRDADFRSPCQEPKDLQPVTYDSVPNFEDYGTGCFLLAASEVHKLQ